MAEDNVEIVRAFFEARNRDDRDEMRALLDPAIEWDMSRSIAPYGGGVVHGVDAVIERWGDFADAWVEGRFEPEEFIASGDDVVVPVFTSGRGTSSGLEYRARGAGVWTVREGRIVRFQLFQTREEALQAAGLTE